MKFSKYYYLSLMLFTYSFSLQALDQYPSVNEASFYNSNAQQQWNVAFQALSIIPFQGTEHVLDIGSGSGKVTANIAGRVSDGSVIGLDLSEGMIEFSKQNYASFYPNLSFVKQDFFAFDSSKKFDLIFSSSSLHWILDHKPLLEKVHEQLNPNGTILFTIPCKPFSEVAAVFQDVISQDKWQTYLTGYNHPRRKFTADEYKALLQQAGFKEIEAEEVYFPYYFETKKEFADWYAAFSPMMFYIPQDLHDVFLRNIVERYLLAFPLDNQGRIVFKQNELIVRAKK